MGDTTWDQGKLVGGLAVVLGVLKFLMGKSRTASVDDRYEGIKKALEEHEAKMNTALRGIRLDIREMRSHQEAADEAASEGRRKVNAALDEMSASLLSFKRAVNSVLSSSSQEHPPSRLR